MVKATKEKFPQPVPEKEEEVVEVKTSAEEMIKATKDEFDPNLVKEQKPSAEQLVQEEKVQAEKEKPPKKHKDVEEAENLFEKLKKKGTLREEEEK